MAAENVFQFNVLRVFLDRYRCSNASRLVFQVYDKTDRDKKGKLKGATFDAAQGCYIFSQELLDIGATISNYRPGSIAVKLIHEGVMNTTLGKSDLQIPQVLPSDGVLSVELMDKKGVVSVGRILIRVIRPAAVMQQAQFIQTNASHLQSVRTTPNAIQRVALSSERLFIGGPQSAHSVASSDASGSRVTAYGQPAHRITLPQKLPAARTTPPMHDDTGSIRSRNTATSPLSVGSSESSYPLSPSSNPPKYGPTQTYSIEQHDIGFARLTQQAIPVQNNVSEGHYPPIDYLACQRKHEGVQFTAT